MPRHISAKSLLQVTSYKNMNQFSKYNIKIKENVSLSQFATYKIGGPAKYFFSAKNADELKKVIHATINEQIPIYIIGFGSNILVHDSGFDGMVIKMELKGIKFKNSSVICGAGVLMNDLLEKVLENNLTGIEYMAGIPTTLGGAVFGNAGAYGRDLSEAVQSVKILDLSDNNLTERILSKQDCEFTYRNSIFKTNKHKNQIITEVTLQLQKGDKEISKAEIDTIIKKRKGAYPLLPSSGCCFKNIVFGPEYKHLEKYQVHGKIPAGRLIDEAGLKGYSIGGAQVSNNHANFIINNGNAKASDIKAIIEHVKAVIFEKFKVKLIEEIEYVGFL